MRVWVVDELSNATKQKPTATMGRAKLKLKPAQRRPPQSPQPPATASAGARGGDTVYLPFPAPEAASARQETPEKLSNWSVGARLAPPSAAAPLLEERQAYPSTNRTPEKVGTSKVLKEREEAAKEVTSRALPATECSDMRATSFKPQDQLRQAQVGKKARVSMESHADSAGHWTRKGRPNEFVCCFPSVLLRHGDGSVVDVIAAIHSSNRSVDAFIVPPPGGKQFDPLDPVLCIEVASAGRLRLIGHLLGYCSTRVASLSISQLSGKEAVDASCRFRGAMMFDKVEWMGTKQENPAEVPLPLPDNIIVEVSVSIWQYLSIELKCILSFL